MPSGPVTTYIIQGMGGMMSVTGLARRRTGRRADARRSRHRRPFHRHVHLLAILAALYRREKTGEGAYIDMALFDTQIAVIANQASNALISGKDPPRQGNTHPNIVPYQPFDAADQPIIIAVGNDRQFARLAEICGHAEWTDDERFASNSARVANREAMVRLVSEAIAREARGEWLDQLEAAGIPAGPINRISQALSDVQAQHRQMVRTIAGVPARWLAGPARRRPRGFGPAAACARRAYRRDAGQPRVRPHEIARLKSDGVAG